MCCTEKAPNAWHRRGTQKTGNTYSQPKRPSTDTTHRPSTEHYRKGNPGVKTHNTNQRSSCARHQRSSCARHQHSNHPPSSPNRVITSVISHESTRAQSPAGSVCAHAGDCRPDLAQGSSMQSSRRKQTHCACETLCTKKERVVINRVAYTLYGGLVPQ